MSTQLIDCANCREPVAVADLINSYECTSIGEIKQAFEDSAPTIPKKAQPRVVCFMESKASGSGIWGNN